MINLTNKLNISSNVIRGFLALAFIVGVASGFFILNNSKDNNTNVYTQSEKIERSGFEVILNNYRFEQIEEPNSGTTRNYVVVDISITNNGETNLPFIPVFQTFVRNADGTTIDMSPLPGIQPIYAGDINPGMTISGELSYYVPEIDQDLLFLFNPGWNDSNAIFIRL